MRPDLEARILADLERVHLGRKSFDAPADWKAVPKSRGEEALNIIASLRINGELGGGVRLRIVTPRHSWEKDVYGQIEVHRPEVKPHLRIAPIEWRPLRDHRNGPLAPGDLALKTFRDRWHPFDLNLPTGIDGFAQKTTGVACNLPRVVSSFSDYIKLASELWNFPDLVDLVPPPWTKPLL